MRKTISRFASNFAALLVDQSTVIDADSRTETIRSAMFQAIYDVCRNKETDSAKVWYDISRANDIQTLWYLRSDVLRLLASRFGEMASRTQLDGITELFRGVVPSNQMPSGRRAIRQAAA